jgi:PEP-CTERM motif
VKKPEAEVIETAIRRRPTRRHRRNRLLRRGLVVVILVAFALGFASVALWNLSPSLFRASRAAFDGRQVEAGRNIVLLTQQESVRQIGNRPVYPYSVVPGGVSDASELKWVAEHDPVVASHYAGFDYDHARIVRLVLARTAYVSYRIGNQVYWTRHRVSLKKGETLLTDGKITARSRCGNRVEEVPQQATSSSEPPAVRFDQPVLPDGTALSNPPVPFESALLNRPSIGPALPLSLYDPFGNGTWIPITPPPLPGVCGIGKNKTGNPQPVKGKGYVCASGGAGGGGAVPEPGTWILVASGLAAMYWKTRQKLVRT